MACIFIIFQKNSAHFPLNGTLLQSFHFHHFLNLKSRCFIVKPAVKSVWPVIYAQVHCGFMKNSGADMDIIDVKYIQKCKFVVASGIFDGYDIPHQPSNISRRSQKLFCFLMVVDEVSLDFIEKNTTVKIDSAGGKWVGIWRLITVHRLPFDEPRRNGKIPKILTHRLFPQAWYSIWIDGKMELIVDPLLILERLAFYLEPQTHHIALSMI